jgi:anti-sigma regulatory factor (Ser/Thr protein kinase)
VRRKLALIVLRGRTGKLGVVRCPNEMPEDFFAPREVSASLAAEPRSISTARGLLAQILAAAGVRGESRSDALIVASELVANAISHGSRSGDEIKVEFAVLPRRVHICVLDPLRGRSALAALSPDEHRPAGRGLQIVEQLAEWSEGVVDGRREVRAELMLEVSPQDGSRLAR